MVAGCVLTILVAGCSVTASPDPNAAFPYPDGCAHFDLSSRRCQFIVRRVERLQNVNEADVQRVELLGDPGCGQPGQCVRTVSFVVRVRLVTATGAIEQMVFCMVGDQYNLICGDHPQLQVSTTAEGFRDIPGDATPLPTLDPAALAKAAPLRLDRLVIPLDHVGSYDVDLGAAVLPNGILSEATIGDATIDPTSILVGDLGIRLTVEPTAGNPPFDNYYVRGWHEGVETVTVHIRFDIPDPPVGGTLTLLGIVVD
jgi:hypothetical protein